VGLSADNSDVDALMATTATAKSCAEDSTTLVRAQAANTSYLDAALLEEAAARSQAAIRAAKVCCAFGYRYRSTYYQLFCTVY
jgi:hypothetical protein